MNPYVICPKYETEHFQLRLVKLTDAENLLKCYSDPESTPLFNSDNCHNDFKYETLEDMERCILDWLDEYNHAGYVRFGIVDKQNKEVIGTVELFARSMEEDKSPYRAGILRLDLRSGYEHKIWIGELLEAIIRNTYKDFDVSVLLTKAIPQGKQRVTALLEKGFSKLEEEQAIPFGNYYVRPRD